MTDTVAQAERVMEQGAQADLAAVLQLAAAGRLRCSDKTQRPTAATVRTVSEVLTSGDFYEGEAVRAFAWPLLLQAGGLAQLSSGRLELTIGGRKVGPGPEAVRDLWRRWLGHGVPDELSRVEAVKGQRVVNVLSAPGPRRKAVGAALAGCCPPGEWLAVDHLFVAMRGAGHDPVVVRSGGPCGSCIWKIRSTAASATTVTTTGRCCRAVTPCVCCSSTRPPSVSSTSAAPPRTGPGTTTATTGAVRNLTGSAATTGCSPSASIRWGPTRPGVPTATCRVRLPPVRLGCGVRSGCWRTSTSWPTWPPPTPCCSMPSPPALLTTSGPCPWPPC